ncbi:MAG: DUF3750 domain-containing protein [Pseudomonadota bacterium]
MLRWVLLLPVFLFLCAIIGGPLAVAFERHPRFDTWREARAGSVEPAGLAAPAGPGTPAVVQVYAARTWGSRRPFAVHTWIAVKPAEADRYELHHVMGWRRNRGLPVVVREQGEPDLPWYGAAPTLLLDLRGPEAEPLIEEIRDAAARYPWQREYRAWPGPNSNTFVAWVGREVPGLGLDLPSTAIGKAYVEIDEALGPSVSGSGVRASLWGVASLSAGLEEGVEINLFGLHAELDLFDLAVELPGVGRIGRPEVRADG